MKRFTCGVLAGVVAAACVGGVVRADVIELSDGRKITGSMQRVGNNMVIKDEGGKATTVAPNDVVKVTLSSNLTPGQTAAAEWVRVSGLIKKADDLQSVISLQEKFLHDFNPDAALAKQVADSLEVFKKLATSGSDGDVPNQPVKFRGRWMLRNQMETTIKAWTDAAQGSADLYRAGKYQETLESVKKVLAEDEQNPDALAIGGLAAFRAGNMPQARTYFTALAAADPSSVLAENNLAVVCVQQKLAGESLLHYGKGLQAKPENRLLLDNIAEALFAYTGDKALNNYTGLVKQYAPAEKAAEAEQAKKGLTRFGGTWVTKDQMDQLTRQQSALKDQMAQMESQYRTTQQQLASVENQLRQAQADYDARSNDILTLTSSILLQQQRGLDTSVYGLQLQQAQQQQRAAQQQGNALQDQRTQLQTALQDLSVRAAKLKPLISGQGVFTGEQRIMDLGEDENPPAPVAVVIPQDALQAPTSPVVVIQTPPAPQPQTVFVPVPVPMQGPVIVVQGGGGGGGQQQPPTTGPATAPAPRGRGGRGVPGPTTQPVPPGTRPK